MSRHERGISLVELLIVVTILGVAATVAIPDISTTSISRLELAAEEHAQAMRYARSEAMRTGEPHGFRQQSSARRIQVFRADTSSNPWTLNYDVYHPSSKKLYDVDLNTHAFAEADSLTRVASFLGGCNQTGNVYFTSSGIPYCADPETVLLDQFDITLTLGIHSRLVRLNGITGRVTVQ